MKIGALLQSLTQTKTNAIQPGNDKTKSEILLDEYKAKDITLHKDVQSIFDKYQITPSPETVKGVNAFMKDAKGTDAEKLQAVEVALYKGIEPTEDNLLSIHEALTHDVQVVKALADTPKVNDVKLPNKEISKVIASLKLPDAIKNELMKYVSKGASLKEALVKVSEALGLALPETDDLSQVIRILQSAYPQVESNVQEDEPKRSVEPAIQLKVENHLQDQVQVRVQNHVQDNVQDKGHDKVQEIEQTKIQMEDQVEVREQVDLNQEIDDQETELFKFISDAVEQVMEQSNAVYQMLSESMHIKTFMVEVTTEATIKAKHTFETFKKETVALLENVQKPENKVDIQNDLTKAVEKINHIILKSDVTLFTDMPTEKKLLVMSSELDKALVLIKEGELNKAKAIVKSATDLLKSIRFSPSQRRVQVFAENKLGQLEKTVGSSKRNDERLDVQIKHHLETHRESRLARDVIETLRFLGLNHEMEVAETIDKNQHETYKEWNQSNIKEILLKLMKDEIENKTVSATEQNLMNLTGQQMMNDSGSEEQPFYFFNMPILEDEEIGNMKIFMKGASKNHQIDWQNSEMYFGISIKGAEPIGIKVKVNKQQLDIELLTDEVGELSGKLERVMHDAEELGFVKGRLSNKPYKASDTKITLKPTVGAQPSFPQSDSKGFDFKV